MADKAQIRAEIAAAERELQALLQERSGMDARRAEAYEADQAALSEAHREYMERTRAGKNASKPVAITQARTEVERRAQQLPVEIDRAQLRLAKAQLVLVTLERSEALAAEKAPRERSERIKEEVLQLQEEERQADQETTNARKRTEGKQAEKFRLQQEVSGLEKAVAARTRVSPLHGTVMG